LVRLSLGILIGEEELSWDSLLIIQTLS
jgi:hypothetical protein